jgi:hypothetical protein
VSFFNYAKWNKEQREGLAKFGDTLAASAVVGAMVGLFGGLTRPMHAGEFALLLIVAALLVNNGLTLRKEYE